MSVDRFPCPCCGYLVFTGKPGSYDICKICFWEDDVVQLRWPDFAGGANRPSLIDAQRTFATTGPTESRFLPHVRPPLNDEPRDRGWRPIDPSMDRFEPSGVKTNDWPDDYTRLYWWRETFWLRTED